MSDRVREALSSGDLEAFLAALDPNVVWRGVEEPGAEPPACRNRDEVREVLEHWLAQGYTGSFEIVADAGDRLVIDPRVEPPVPGLEELHHVYTVRADRIVEMQDYRDRESALAAAGVEP